MKWIPIIHSILHDEKRLNWDSILSQNITNALELSLISPPDQKHIFYMFSFLMDIIIVLVPFPLMKWNYPFNQQLPIHNYAQILWEINSKFHLYDIFHYIVIPLHEVIFVKAPPRISEGLKEGLKSICHCFFRNYFLA